MPITETQKGWRRKHVGSSDVAAILGLSPYRNAHDVFIEKTQDVEDLAENKAMSIGNVVEDSLLDWAAETLGVSIVRNQYRVADDGLFACQHDALVAGQLEGVEAKTAGIMHPFGQEDWGDDGTEEIPEHVLVQCQQQMHVSRLNRVHVPTLIGCRGLTLYRVERSEPLIQIIIARCTAFWREHVETGEPPEDLLPDMDLLKRVRRQPTKVVDMDPAAVAEWLTAKVAEKKAEEQASDAQKALLVALGDAEVGRLTDLTGEVTYFEQGRSYVDGKALAAEHPEIAARYQRETRFRVLRFRKPKKAKKERTK